MPSPTSTTVTIQLVTTTAVQARRTTVTIQVLHTSTPGTPIVDDGAMGGADSYDTARTLAMGM